MSSKPDTPKAPEVIERFVKALVVTAKAVALYPPSSSMPRDAAKDVVRTLREVFQERSDLRLIVTKQGLFFDDLPVFPEQPAYEQFAQEIYNRKLAEIRFHVGIDLRDVVGFLSVLKYSPEEVEAAGGFEGRLWELGVATITVKEMHITIVDAAATDGSSEGAETQPRTRAEIDELLSAAYGGRHRDQMVIVRFLNDAPAVGEYLSQTFESVDEGDVLAVGERFAELAAIAYESAGGVLRHATIKSLSEALGHIDPSLRRTLLIDEILPEARTNEALAAVIRQMDMDDVCHMLVDGVEGDAISRDGLARAVRNLALISLADRSEVTTAAGAAMRGAGFSEEVVGSVLEMAAPSHLTVRERATPRTQQAMPSEAIFKLLDVAPVGHKVGDAEDDPGLVALRDEARRGITDGDVIMALVSLASLDTRSNQFASTMSLLEDALGMIVERGDLDIAADAIDSLMTAARNPGLDRDQVTRLEKAIGSFTKPSDIKAIAHALRLYAEGTAEHTAATRILSALGPAAIEPLLEQLAEEPDMAARKSLIDLLSDLAPRFVDEFGRHVNDPRWYVVRNVIAILSSSRTLGILPYVERTVRHPEPRVRREAIRALSAIPDRIAQRMLVSALTDEDGQNVQLAARYLGVAKITDAVGGLTELAKGEGHGNRDTGPRVEAIEALGRIGDPAALPVLEMLAGKRAILGMKHARELRAAAESAIGHIHSAQRGA